MTPRLSIEDVSKRYGQDSVLHPTSLALAPGELLAVLGPSGCGKTTLLSIVAGLVAPTTGNVRLDGRSLAGLPPEARGIPMVFQDHLLFPGMSVRRNIAFGLEMQKTSRGKIANRVDEALTAMRLTGLGDRYPSQLSGGQRQRVALARALVLRPRVLLMDEPFSNLDTALRQEMRELLVEMRDQFGFTALVVTHDPEEALALADRVAVMKAGRILQCDAPASLYEKPRSRFVAAFLGPANFVNDLCIRPEALRLHADPVAGALTATVRRNFFAGSRLIATLDAAGTELRWHGSPDEPAAALARQTGRQVYVTWDIRDSTKLDASSPGE